MQLSEFYHSAIPMIEEEMKTVLLEAKQKQDFSLYQMLTYHLGWSGENRTSKSMGKRIRPLLVLLSNAVAGGNWKKTIPAASTIELIHNFSLIHDDIEDMSKERRGRKTLWAIHGIPLAINAGDALFSLSFLAITRLTNNYPIDQCAKAHALISNACIDLTKGQHLDISFESFDKVDIEHYIDMIRCKTAALLATSMELGALLSGADEVRQALFHKIGENIGLAFQIYDDILGIWGDAKKTGKSAATDILSRKKTLPILYGLAQEGIFMEMWRSDYPAERISEMANQLINEGAYDYAKSEAERYTQTALSAVEKANPSGPFAGTFNELIESLTMREF